jgi:hypothetical protein
MTGVLEVFSGPYFRLGLYHSKIFYHQRQARYIPTYFSDGGFVVGGKADKVVKEFCP